MVSIKKNYKIWNSIQHWEQGTFGPGGGLENGEKWSRAWGDSRSEWNVTIYPRIQRFLPTQTIIEIGAGRGRWSQYLKEYCSQLKLVEISETCIEHCQKQFAGVDGMSFHVTDGKSLPDIKDSSVDFIFSFDSLVHADAAVIEAYLLEARRVLRAGGSGFIHHSNLAEYGKQFRGHSHMRDLTVSAELFGQCCIKVGLECISQEKIPWTIDNAKNKKFIDSFTIVTKTTSEPQHRKPVVFENLKFTTEQCIAKQIFQLYGAPNAPLTIK